MKGKKKLLTATLAVAFTAMLGAPVSAATTYTPVAGTSCNFNKYLIMDAGDTVPNATFSFTIDAGDAISADTSDNTVMEVIPGVVVKTGDVITAPAIADVTFAPTDTTSTVAGSNIDVARPADDRAAGLAATTGVQLESGEKYATKQATVNFSGVSFNEPGIYRYIITETADANHEAAGIMHDNDVDRVLDVYVTDDGTGTLVVSSYVMHTDNADVEINTTMGSADVTTAGAALDDKTDGFTNEYNTKDLVFRKEVTGNQASRDKYFEFTATVGNVNDDDVFVVSLGDDSDNSTTDGDADATSGTTAATRTSNQGKTNPTSVTGAQLKAGQKFYLQHGQSIAIRGIAPNATYAITEDEEDYKSIDPSAYTETVKVTGFTDQTATDSTKATIGAVAGDNKAVKTSYLNERTGIIPTGILISVAGLIVAAVVVIAGIIFFGARSRKKYNEED